MSKVFKIEDQYYKYGDLSEKGQATYSTLVFVGISLSNKKNEMALLTRAKNGYIEDLKAEVIEKKSGVNFDALLSDD